MHKSFSLLILVLLQCACASQPGPVEASNSLISFNDIAAEISVSYQEIAIAPDELAATSDQYESVAQGLIESP